MARITNNMMRTLQALKADPEAGAVGRSAETLEAVVAAELVVYNQDGSFTLSYEGLVRLERWEAEQARQAEQARLRARRARRARAAAAESVGLVKTRYGWE
jgi:hypothetical protein